MARYGSDKPDTRFGMQIHDLTDILKESQFSVFKDTACQGGAIEAICVPGCAGPVSYTHLDVYKRQSLYYAGALESLESDAGSQGALFSGDLIFRLSVGRTDFPGGDMNTLLQSIRTKVLTLPDETVIYPGHNWVTTVGKEREENPFLA